MKTVTINAFEFSELSDEAKAKAREWYREICQGDNSFSEFVIEEAVREGEFLGFEFKTTPRKNRKGEPMSGEPRIYWSGFSCQGGGACFEATWRASAVQANKVAEGWGEDPATTEIKRIAEEFRKLSEKHPEAQFTTTHSGRYSHERSVQFKFDLGMEKPASHDYLDFIEEIARDFMRWIYRRLESEYEYQNSDEQVDESIVANEYLFTQDGSRTVAL